MSLQKATRPSTRWFLLILAGLVAFLYHQSLVTASLQAEEAPELNLQALHSLGLAPQPPTTIMVNGKPKVLHGRFLHITDMHPDLDYVAGALIDEMCHRGKGGASKYGDAVSGCDSPMPLVEETIRWIKTNLADKIDFVIWTGDNVRHDNDRQIPRSEPIIFDLNELVAQIMYKAFKRNDSPDPQEMDVLVIPSLGNNDVYPHNLFAVGPTLQTREMWRIWRNFVPAAQMHTFVRGAYFFKEVVPGRLAVLSLNTLYWFESNPLVDNCDSSKQPGYDLFRWLGATLDEARARGMKVWLLGHVPPLPKNYDPTCFRKYVVWVHEYRDVIIGGLYGHMNMDHFVPLDAIKAYKLINESYGHQGFTYDFDQAFAHHLDDVYDTEVSLNHHYAEEEEFPADRFHALGGIPTGKVGYIESVRDDFYATLKEGSSRYSIVHVTPSVIPTFNPGLRVWEYNTTGAGDRAVISGLAQGHSWDSFFQTLDAEIAAEKRGEFGVTGKIKPASPADGTFPKRSPVDMKLGPAYTPQTFSPTRYVQYYLDLEAISEGKKEFAYEVEYTTDDKNYGMPGLLVDDWLTLAKTLAKKDKGKGKKHKGKKHKGKKGKDKKGKGKKGKDNHGDDEEKSTKPLWETFLANSFVSCGYEDMDLDWRHGAAYVDHKPLVRNMNLSFTTFWLQRLLYRRKMNHPLQRPPGVGLEHSLPPLVRAHQPFFKLGPNTQSITDNELIMNAFYFFLVLVAMTVALGGITFAISEYVYLIEGKSKSATSAKIRVDNTWSASSNTTVPKMVPLEAPQGAPRLDSRVYPLLEHPQLDLIEESPPLHTAASLEIHMTAAPQTTRYTMKQLLDLEPEEEQPQESEFPKGVQGPVHFPRTRFPSAWALEKTVMELRQVLMNKAEPPIAPHDHVSKKLHIVQFVGIGISTTPFDNPHVFASAFSDLVEHIVDTGAVFDLIEAAPAGLAVRLVEVILQYCWSQWTFLPACTEIHRHFDTHQGVPFVQPSSAVFRFLCNLELGIYTSTQMATAKLDECDAKIVGVLREVCLRAKCNDYLGFLPMLAQAVAICDRPALKRLFYELLQFLVEGHYGCCMREYIGEARSDLRNLIQHGLWRENERAVRQTAEATHSLLVKHNPATMRWWKEVEGGRVWVLASEFSATNLDSKAGEGHGSGGAGTPGGWSASTTRSPVAEPPTRLNRSPSIRNFATYEKKPKADPEASLLPGAFSWR